MKRYLKLLFAASIITLFNACETDVYDPEKIENTKDLVAPADFDWKTTQSLTYSITSKVNTVISVYTDRNCTDESLLIENFALKANIPRQTDRTYWKSRQTKLPHEATINLSSYRLTKR